MKKGRETTEAVPRELKLPKHQESMPLRTPGRWRRRKKRAFPEITPNLNNYLLYTRKLASDRAAILTDEGMSRFN